ncbi:hypothetical protein NQ317_001674 [Molorchus minor]|uniref:ETS domain-containing protein n=1 Tax=Molorchus minor TaxID=1323400 RepID=A0ABQ9JHV6_9CUCU|nr:hypothetical protein NQ317_001674 [Molorchus minor]
MPLKLSFFLDSKLLWDYLQQLLNDPQERFNHVIHWKNRLHGIFKIVDPPLLARLWGIRKNIPTMTYDKLSRSLRYYYKCNKLRKVPRQRQVYQFLFSNSQPPLIDPDFALYFDELNKQNRGLQNQIEHELVTVKEEHYGQ